MTYHLTGHSPDWYIEPEPVDEREAREYDPNEDPNYGDTNLVTRLDNGDVLWFGTYGVALFYKTYRIVYRPRQGVWRCFQTVGFTTALGAIETAREWSEAKEVHLQPIKAGGTD